MNTRILSTLANIHRQSGWLHTIEGLATIVLLGLLDYLTGPQISFSIFYLLPISFVTWFADLGSGMIAAFVSAAIWLTADLASGFNYFHPLVPYWNAIVRLIFFLVVVSLETALKSLNQGLEFKVKDRTASLMAEIAEREKTECRLKQISQQLSILHEIDQAILQAETLEEIGQSTVRHVMQLLPCQRVSFRLFDFQSYQVILYIFSIDEANVRSFERRIPLEPPGDYEDELEILRRGEPQLFNDLSGSRLQWRIIDAVRSRGFCSLMIIPLIAQSELIGSLNLMSYHSDVFTSEHLEIGSGLAYQLGSVVENMRLLEQLRANQEKLQALSQRLIDVQETERRHIAREMHDEIGQALTGLKLTLEMISHQPNRAAANSIEQAYSLVVDLMERVSQLSLDLRPAMLDDLGLLPALLWYIDHYSSRTGVNIFFRHAGLEERRFLPEIETAAYRIIQEALTNIARHAKTKNALVALWVDQDILGINVKDEGIGFDPNLALSQCNSGGLVGMQERALLLGGRLSIESNPGRGTRLVVELPLNKTSMNDNGISL